MLDVRFLLAGDSAIAIELGNEISAVANQRIHAFHRTVTQSGIEGIVETVPTYRSLMVHYKPDVIDYQTLEKKLRVLLDRLDAVTMPPRTIIEIPVLYAGETGPDIEYVAQYHNKTVEEIINIHTAPEYLIYMIGFVPGFPYLGGLSKDIATPRLQQPRLKVDSGSVGIAGEQTGIYPLDSPGGWRIIGKTPLKLFDPDRNNPILLEAGQFIKFQSIGKWEYEEIADMVFAGIYQCNEYPQKEQS